MKYQLTKDAEAVLLEIDTKAGVQLEGNIVKLLQGSSLEFTGYLKKCADKDAETRRKRLEVTRQVQDQNKELQAKAKENEELMAEIKEALEAAEHAKAAAISDLDVMQKRTQFELIGNIVNYALYVIVGTGLITTAMYVMSILQASPETTLIGNTWSNLFGILLTNSFSIIGTIMGVKYANENKKGDSNE